MVPEGYSLSEIYDKKDNDRVIGYSVIKDVDVNGVKVKDMTAKSEPTRK
jgi:hypothetical protein